MTDVAAGGVGTVFVAEKDALRVAADLRIQGYTTQIVEDFVVKTDDPIWAYRSVRVTVPLRPGEQPWSSNANPSGVYAWYMSTGAILSHAAALLEVSRTAITADLAKEVTQRFTLEPSSRPPLHSRTSTTSSAGGGVSGPPCSGIKVRGWGSHRTLRHKRLGDRRRCRRARLLPPPLRASARGDLVARALRPRPPRASPGR